MDIWQRFERLVRSWASVPEEDEREWHDAWEEIEEFLRARGEETSRRRTPGGTTLDQQIAQAYRDLEVEPGADLATLRSSYRRLLVRYHPDRHADDPDRHATATEITRRLTLAYQLLRAYTE